MWLGCGAVVFHLWYDAGGAELEVERTVNRAELRAFIVALASLTRRRMPLTEANGFGFTGTTLGVAFGVCS